MKTLIDSNRRKFLVQSKGFTAMKNYLRNFLKLSQLGKTGTKYELMVNNGSYESKLIVRGNTKHYHLAEQQTALTN